MARLTFIRNQIKWVDKWTTHPLDILEEIHWQVQPDLGSSINWQVGHIVISKYFHAVHSIVADDNRLKNELRDLIPIEDFFKFYFAGSDPKASWDNRPNKVELLGYLSKVNTQTSFVLDSLKDEELDEKTFVNNPVARTKYDALTFCFKHQMWHNGQIAMLSRLLRSANE